MSEKRNKELRSARAEGAAVERNRCLGICLTTFRDLEARLTKPMHQILTPTELEVRVERVKMIKAVIQVIAQEIAGPSVQVKMN